MIPMEPKTQVPPVREQQHPSSRELQKKGLEMARYFKDFCEAHDLLFYFCGGCCIGAIRHKGFIPWDDDVDFFMPREDYEKLKVLWPREADTQRYTLVTQTETLVDHNLFITIRDNNTTAVKPYQKGIDMCHGLAMDILPLERRERFQDKCRLIIERYGLSEREGEIMIMFAKGRNLAYIQDELFISKSTVSTHRQHIYKKLGIHSQQELLDLVQAANPYGE